jgi:LmbE family N-acetylglucosaminyl deacetylase
MKRFLVVLLLASACFAASPANAQSTAPVQTIKGPDERFKTDILVVVAHPDDEGGVTPYLARAIYDEHKRVAVVFATRGGSGGNDYSREHGPALADIREQEARQACAKLGITNVWFLDGKDTASQNVLNSLANWGHGANLEALVRIVRLTRPEVIITWLPGISIGENHGDHQASGVLATEAFDLANDPTAFPAQVAGASKRLEVYLENLTPWQPKKLYFFSDADDQKQFAGTGPAYSVKEISPSQKKPYWRLALDAATPHLTQFPAEIHQLTAMSDEQLNKFMDDPQHQWWTEPMTLIFGKAAVSGKPTDDVLANLDAGPALRHRKEELDRFADSRDPWVAIGGPWFYYNAFYSLHAPDLKPTEIPEIEIKAGTNLLVPIVIGHAKNKTSEVTVECQAPPGWKIIRGVGRYLLPPESRTELALEIVTPELNGQESKNGKPVEVSVSVSAGGKSIGDVRLKVLLKTSALPQ